MIFVTVGTQLPFDRLIAAVDSWALKNRSEEIFAQIGNGDYSPENIKFVRYLTKKEFDIAMREASIIICHAGIGSILSAIDYKVPIVVCPRLAKYGEHRNDHQTATVSRLCPRLGIPFWDCETDLSFVLHKSPPGDSSNLVDMVTNLKKAVKAIQ